MANTKIPSELIDGTLGVAGITSSADATAITINSSEQVGIGTTSPNARLVVSDSGDSPVRFISSGQATNYLELANTGGSAMVFSNNNDLVFGTSNSPTERMRINNSGNVGIGATTIDAKLHIEVSSGDANLKLEDGSATYMLLDQNSIGGSDVIRFKTGGSLDERMRISSVGNVGINITAPDNVGTFGVKQGGQTATAFALYGHNDVRYVFCLPNGNYGYQFVEKIYSNGGYNRHFQNVSNTSVGSIVVNASSTAFNTTSDYRLKDNPQPLTGSGEFIDALQPKTWEWNHSDAGIGVGFIAHEAAEVGHGLCVTGEKDATTLDNILNEETGEHSEQTVPLYQQLDYSSGELIANMVAELQSLRARVAELENN